MVLRKGKQEVVAFKLGWVKVAIQEGGGGCISALFDYVTPNVYYQVQLLLPWNLFFFGNFFFLNFIFTLVDSYAHRQPQSSLDLTGGHQVLIAKETLQAILYIHPNLPFICLAMQLP